MPKSKIVRHTTEELKEMARRGEDRTDWNRVRKMKDSEIVVDDDAPEITAEMMRRAVVTDRRTKDNISLRVDHDVLEWFREQGRGYQTRINAVLRAYVQTVRKAS